MCIDCPFRAENTLKYKPDIYEDVRDKNRGQAHICHMRNSKLCEGFLHEAYQRLDRDVLRDGFERGDLHESARIKEMIIDVDVKLGNIK